MGKVMIGDYDIQERDIWYLKGVLDLNLEDSFKSFMKSARGKRNGHICLVINSRGGLAYFNFHFDWIRQENLITYGYRRVYSLAMGLLQTGKARYSNAVAEFMYHGPIRKDGSGGREASEEERIRRNWGEILSRRTGKTTKQLWDEFSDGKYMSAMDAMKNGFIDDIAELPYEMDLALDRIKPPYFSTPFR